MMITYRFEVENKWRLPEDFQKFMVNLIPVSTTTYLVWQDDEPYAVILIDEGVVVWGAHSEEIDKQIFCEDFVVWLNSQVNKDDEGRRIP